MGQSKKYLEIKLDKSDLFVAKANFRLMNFERKGFNVRIVLGYPYTVVPIRTLGADSATASTLKEFDEKKAVENAKIIRETLPIETWCKAIYDIYRT